MIGANHAASATLSKCISPSAAAMTPPAMMPMSTAMLARNPCAKRASAMTMPSTTSERMMFEIGA